MGLLWPDRICYKENKTTKFDNPVYTNEVAMDGLREQMHRKFLLAKGPQNGRTKNGYRRIYAGGNPAMDYHPIQGGVETLLPNEPLGSTLPTRPTLRYKFL